MAFQSQPIGTALVRMPTHNHYAGPFLSSADRVYMILTEEVDRSKIAAVKNTNADPFTANWAIQDSANAPVHAQDALSVWAFQVGDVLHVASIDESITRVIRYHTFNMATDLWVIVDEAVDTADAGTTFCSLAVRDDGDVIIFRRGNQDTVHATNYDRVDYDRREAAVWTLAIQVDNGGEDHWGGGVVVKGASDRMHFFFKNEDLDDGFQRTLTSANVLETFPAAGDSAMGTYAHPFKAGILYTDGGIDKIRCPYAVSGSTAKLAEIDSVDAPGAFTVKALAANPLADNSSPHAGIIENTATGFHYLVQGTLVFTLDAEIVDAETWSELSTITARNISVNVYTRDNELVLAGCSSEAPTLGTDDEHYWEEVLDRLFLISDAKVWR